MRNLPELNIASSGLVFSDESYVLIRRGLRHLQQLAVI
jgi:hypothetical protein